MGNSQIPLRYIRIPGGSNTGAIFGIMLITGGTLLFIDNLNILPIALTDAFWPILLAIVSGIGLWLSSSLAIRIWCITGLAASALLILGIFGVIHARADILWPLALIATGIIILMYRLRWPELAGRFNIGSEIKGGSRDNRLQEAAIFSGVRRRVQSPVFTGGDLNTIFGSIEVDLRDAGTASPRVPVLIEANALFGGIEIRVPESWTVNIQGTAIFGTYHDKTIPPRPEPGLEPSTLVIHGGTAFGSVIVRN